jgi:hypothetical protein
VEEREGTELVIFFNAKLPLVEAWRRTQKDLPADIPVLADPDATVYDALGTERKSNYASLMRGSLGPLWKSAREGRFAHATRADMLRLGADVAVRPDGEIAKLHIAHSMDDRVPVRELVDALTATTPS